MRVARFTVTIAPSVYDARRVKRYYNRIVPVKKRSFGLMFRLWALYIYIHIYISGVTRCVKFQYGENCVSGFVSLPVRFTCSDVTRYMNHIQTLYCIRSLCCFYDSRLCISLICASLYTACNTRKVQALIRRTYQKLVRKTLSRVIKSKLFIYRLERWNVDRNFTAFQMIFAWQNWILPSYKSLFEILLWKILRRAIITNFP